MASSACCSSRLALAVLLTAGAAQAQSSHLTRLEVAAPAVAIDPISAVAVGGWTSVWMAPASGHGVRGLLLGIEHADFSSVTTVFAGARFRAGPLWQLSFAQTSVSDLFDPALLAQYPELGTLKAAATSVAVDGMLGFGAGAGLSLGGRYERDEFLGDATGSWLARVSGTGPTVLGVRSAAVLERGVGGGASAIGPGRLRLGLARQVGSEPVALTLAAGAIVGHLWEIEGGRARVAGSVRITLLRLLSLSGAYGAERDPFGDGGWLSFVSFGVGLRLGSVGANVRRGDVGASDAVPTAVSLTYNRGEVP